MGFRVYAKAGTMRVNPFRDGDADTAQVTLENYDVTVIALNDAKSGEVEATLRLTRAMGKHE